VSLRRLARATREVCGALLLFVAARCNLYEGRSLDLFSPARELLVECREPSDCERDRPYCAGGSCVRCLIDADCDRRHPACVGNACVECRSAEDCPADQACNSVLNSCAPACSEQGTCAGPELGSCSLELGVCVQCAADADCREPRNPRCGRGGRCGSCRDDQSCAADAGAPPPEPEPEPMPQPDGMRGPAPGMPQQPPMPAPAAP
jgi:hypothetical protein